MSASLDHAIWFHRPSRADEWHIHDFTAHGYLSSRGLGIGHVLSRDGIHVATVAQEVLLRTGHRRASLTSTRSSVDALAVHPAEGVGDELEALAVGTAEVEARLVDVVVGDARRRRGGPWPARQCSTSIEMARWWRPPSTSS